MSLIGGCPKCGRIRAFWNDELFCPGCLNSECNNLRTALREFAHDVDEMILVKLDPYRLRNNTGGSILRSLRRQVAQRAAILGEEEGQERMRG